MHDLLFATGLTVGIDRLAVPPTWQGFARRHLGFAVGQRARRDDRPNRVRHPTDRSFASWCSPPPLTGTQFLSATEPKSGSDRDSHPAGSTHSRSHWPQACSLRNPDIVWERRLEAKRIRAGCKPAPTGRLRPEPLGGAAKLAPRTRRLPARAFGRQDPWPQACSLRNPASIPLTLSRLRSQWSCAGSRQYSACPLIDELRLPGGIVAG
jgi:hypothetical protein